MSRIVNGILTVPSFDPTGNPGEYTITGGAFTSQTDLSGSGAFLVEVGFVLYVPASDPNTFMQIPGTVHRYRITALSITDATFINCTIVWDEVGDEIDTPTNGADCIISQVTPNRSLGLPVDPLLYTTLPQGAATGAYNVDTEDILDKSISGSSYKFVQPIASTEWTVTHNKNSSDFIYTLFDSNGAQVTPDAVVAVSENEIRLNVLQAMTGKLVLVFVG